ncbi:MAG: hypothetical protein GY953_28770, partial [bacterium]|nr:hypothetical protein [bacterium]
MTRREVVLALSAGSAVKALVTPRIDIWYGAQQRFGHLGRPQRWINILGAVS